jgi:hypothetical protein
VIILPAKCPICGERVESSDGAFSFPPIFDNEAEPLFKFNETVAHSECVRNSDVGRVALQRKAQFEAKASAFVCAACSRRLLPTERYLVIPFLEGCDDELKAFSYSVLHPTCFASWLPSRGIIKCLEAQLSQGTVRGRSMEHSISELRVLIRHS